MASIQLFVVGSLCEGMIHHRLIQNFITKKSLCTIPGHILRNKVGYPFLVEDPGSQIKGWIYEIEASDVLISLIDQHNGFNALNPVDSLTEKKLVQGLTEDGQTVAVWAYFSDRHKIKEPLFEVREECWMESLKKIPPLPEKLSEKQKTYIKKLGASSGRDIVPIDLTLYRELISLELIVDKGRRLALSGLGREVYKYIGAAF